MLSHLFGRYVSFVGHDRPVLPEGILHHARAVAIEVVFQRLDYFCARSDCALEHGIAVLHVETRDRRGGGPLVLGFAHHHHRPTKIELGVAETSAGIVDPHALERRRLARKLRAHAMSHDEIVKCTASRNSTEPWPGFLLTKKPRALADDVEPWWSNLHDPPRSPRLLIAALAVYPRLMTWDHALRGRMVGLVLLFWPALAMPAEGQSGTDDEARAIYQAGLVAYENGRFDEALRHFQSSYALSGRPELLYNIATAAERSKHALAREPPRASRHCPTPRP